MTQRHRILVMSHAHPDFSLGGGELAAYNIFQGYRDHPGVEDAWFLGRADRGRGATGAISLRRPNEYLWEQSVGDWHKMKAAHQESVTTWFAELIRALKPTIVHTHHYAHLGLEYLRVIKQVDPGIRIYMTLHEYMAICRNNGQMVKTGGLRLCSSESFDECRQCFPEHTAEDFWLRKHFFQSYFELVDGFVSPSEFLKQRYVAWGLDSSRIEVIENGLAQGERVPLRPLHAGDIRGRFAYFGQVNPFKGVDVILQAFASLPKDVRKQVSLDIFGSALSSQTPEFQEKIEKLLKNCKDMVRLHGPYEQEEMPRLMAEVDWVVMGSVWWENSPLVIQEAYKYGRPIICPDIGGMAEKVKPGVGGLHFRARDSVSLASLVERIVEEPDLYSRLYESLPGYPEIGEATRKHIELYQKILAEVVA